jgi:hypothetical protein
MSSPVNPWPGNLPPGIFARQFLRALWLECSADIVSGAIDAGDTYTVYGLTYTVASVTTGSFGQVVLTDTSGYGWSIPSYACPAYFNTTAYDAPESAPN